MHDRVGHEQEHPVLIYVKHISIAMADTFGFPMDVLSSVDIVRWTTMLEATGFSLDTAGSWPTALDCGTSLTGPSTYACCIRHH